MPSIKPEFMEKLKEKFGDRIDIEANSDVLKEMFAEVMADQTGVVLRGYGRSYVRDYDKTGYTKEYNQYDKTDDTDDL